MRRVRKSWLYHVKWVVARGVVVTGKTERQKKGKTETQEDV
jgi:hypothetical protein